MQPIIFRFSEAHNGSRKLGVGPSLQGALPLPASSLTLAGVSRDSTGAALAGCTCTLFRVNTQNGLPTFTQVAAMVSDGSGNYSFVVGTDGPYRVTFDLDGAPVRAGISLKTLAGVAQ